MLGDFYVAYQKRVFLSKFFIFNNLLVFRINLE